MITMWRALRGNLAFFLVGAVLGACLVTIATPTKSDIQSELDLIQIDTARNTERIDELNRELQNVFAWMAASDRQKVRDAEILGEMHVTVANHDKLVWLAFGNLIAITILLGRHFLIDRFERKKKS